MTRLGTRAVIAMILPGLLLSLLAPASASASTPIEQDRAPYLQTTQVADLQPHVATAKGASSLPVRLGPGGAATWLGIWWDQGSASASLRIAGLPNGVSVEGGDVPGLVSGDKRAGPVSGCSGDSSATVCDVTRGDGSGELTPFVSALRFEADRGAAKGSATVRVSLLSGGAEVVTTEVGLVVGDRTPLTWALGRSGAEMIRSGEPQQVEYHPYLLSGPLHGERTSKLSIRQGVHIRLFRTTAVVGSDYSCRKQSCVLTGRAGVSQSLPPLVVEVNPRAKQVRNFAKEPRARAWTARWSTKATLRLGGTKAGLRLAQELPLLPAYRQKKLEYTSAAQSLADTRKARVTAKLTRLGDARLGGHGLWRVDVSNGGSRTARSVRVRLNVPDHARVVATRTPSKWRYANGQLRWSGMVAAKRSLPPVEVKLVSDGGESTGPGIAALISWQGSSKGRSRARVVDPEPWLPTASVALSASRAEVPAGEASPVVLAANLSGTQGRLYSYRWQQVCGGHGACPRVSWRGRASGQGSHESLTRSFTVERLRKPAKLQFRLRVVIDGQTISRTVGVRVARQVGDAVQRWDPRTASVGVPSAAQARQRLQANPEFDQTAQPRRMARVWVNSAGYTSLKKRKKTRVQLRTKLLQPKRIAGVQRIRWRIDGQPVKRVDGATAVKRGRILQVHPGAQFRRDRIATVYVTHRSGAVTTASHLLQGTRSKYRIGESAKSKTRAQALPAPELGAAVTAPTFCDVFDGAASGEQVSVGPLSLTLGTVTTSGSACGASGASLSFTGGSLTVDGVSFTDVSGSFTSSELSLSAGKVSLPGAVSGLTLSDVSLSATFSDSGLGSLSGSVSVSDFPYVSLPSGWSLQSATLSVSSAGEVSAVFAASGPDSGLLKISGDYASGSFTLAVSATNVFTLVGSDSTTATFSGSGTISVSAAGVSSFAVSAAMSTTDLELFSNFELTSASVAINDQGFSFDAGADLSVGSDTVAFTVTGSIAGASTWSITVTASGAISIGSLTLTDASGTVAMNSGKLTFSVSVSLDAAAGGSFLGFTVDTVTASLTNACPSTASSCSATDIELQLAVTGTYTFFTDDIAVDTSVLVDLATGDWDFVVSLTGKSFGPAEASLTEVQFFATDDAANYPSTSGNPCLSSSVTGTVFGFTATATVTDVSFTVAGVYADGDTSGASGYCFYGQAATTGNLANMDLAATAAFVYSTYAVTVPDVGAIPAQTPTFYATMTLQPEIQEYLDNLVEGFTVTLEILTTDGVPSGFKVSGSIDLENVYIAGNSDASQTSMSLTQLGMSVSVKFGAKNSVGFGFDAQGTLHTPASSNGDVQAANVGMEVSLTLGEQNGANIVTVAAYTTNTSPVPDAFGVQGLTLNDLALSATVGFRGEEPIGELGVAASVDLPASVTDPIDMAAGTPVSLAFDVGDLDNCFKLQIGLPSDTTSVINWGEIITAYYINLLISPTGSCVVDNVTYDGNFQFDFDGYILGVATDINGEIDVAPSFSADITANVAAFNLAGMDINQTTLDINSSATDLDIAFSGGANLFGAVVVNMSGTLSNTIGATGDSLSFTLDGNLSENLFGLFDANANVSMDVSLALTDNAFTVNTLDFTIGGSVQVLFLTASATLTFDYSGGAVQSLSGSADVDLNLWLVNIDGWVSFSYSAGDPDIAVTIGGTFTAGFSIFTTSWSVSTTIDIPSGNIATSEYTPAPTQVVSAPPPSGTTGTVAGIWDYYVLNGIGGLADDADAGAAMRDFVGGDTNSQAALYFYENSFGQLDRPQGLAPGGYPTTSSPGSTLALPNTATISIDQHNTTMATSSNYGPSYATLDVTVTVPQGPMGTEANNTWDHLPYNAKVQWPQDPFAVSTDASNTFSYTIQLPQWASTEETQWNYAIYDLNWRMQAAYMRSIANVVTNGFGSHFVETSGPGDFVIPSDANDPYLGRYYGILPVEVIIWSYYYSGDVVLLTPGNTLTIDDGYDTLSEDAQGIFNLIANNDNGFAWSCLHLNCAPGAYPYSIGVPYDDSYVPPDSPSPSS